MQNTTSIVVKCECTIPFHSELNRYLEGLSNGDEDENISAAKIPHRDAIAKAINTKMLFIRIDLRHPIRKMKPKLIAVVKRLFNKDLVGTIKVGKEEITLILL